MSITIVTGVPGSGKTLLTVSELLRGIVGTTVPAQDKDGKAIEIQRTVYTNINGLLLDHELIDGNEEAGLRGWHKWAKPGALICYDEFQKVWPPRPNGSKVPDDIQALDTHRHMGVDFILVCQHLMNVDRHILGLCDRHMHVRRVANMPLSVVYEWDHASRSLLYKNALTKRPWRFPKDAFKLYKSAEIHTKQRRKMPGLVWFILAGLVGAAWAAPAAFSRISDRMDPTKNATLQAVAQDHKAAAPGAVVATAAAGSEPVAPGQPGQAEPVEISGCVYQVNKGCSCFTAAGRKVEVQEDICTALEATRKPLAANALPESNLPTLAQADALQSLKESRGPMRAE